ADRPPQPPLQPRNTGTSLGMGHHTHPPHRHRPANQKRQRRHGGRLHRRPHPTHQPPRRPRPRHHHPHRSRTCRRPQRRQHRPHHAGTGPLSARPHRPHPRPPPPHHHTRPTPPQHADHPPQPSRRAAGSWSARPSPPRVRGCPCR